MFVFGVIGYVICYIAFTWLTHPTEVTYVQVAHAETATTTVATTTPVVWDKVTIKKLVYEKAAKYHTYGDKMWAVVNCEDPGLDPNQQSFVVKNGVREDSWGLAQWHLTAGNKTADGRVITKEIAIDPEQAIDAMAYYFANGEAWKWTCYRNLYSK